MNNISLQTLVAEKIKTLYTIFRELEQRFSGRHYTPSIQQKALENSLRRYMVLTTGLWYTAPILR